MISWIVEVTVGSGSGYPGRHGQVRLLMSFQIQGVQRRGDGKDRAPPSSEGVGVRWASLAIFLLALGLNEVCTGDAWNLPSEGTGVVFFSGWSVQQKGLVQWRQPAFHSAACMRAYRQRHAQCTRSAPPPPPRPRQQQHAGG